MASRCRGNSREGLPHLKTEGWAEFAKAAAPEAMDSLLLVMAAMTTALFVGSGAGVDGGCAVVQGVEEGGALETGIGGDGGVLVGHAVHRRAAECDDGGGDGFFVGREEERWPGMRTGDI